MTNIQREIDETIIRCQLGKIIESIAAKDLQALGQVYAADVVSFDVEPPLQHVGREAKLRNWQQVFAIFETVDYELVDLAVSVGDKVAYGHGFGRLSGTVRDGTKTDGMWVRATFCFTKINGSWLITHDQASVPFDFRSGRGVIDRQP